MAASKDPPSGPNFAAGVPLGDIPPGGALGGHVNGEPVLVSQLGGRLHAVGGACTHYGGALAEGLVVGDTVRCPLHHACFSLRTGEALSAPAFDALRVWAVELRGDTVYVGEELPRPKPAPVLATTGEQAGIVIIGGGAAGFAAAEMLRRRGYDRSVTMLSAEAELPCDRPNLSKDYLAGSAPEAWIPLKGRSFYRDKAIDLRLGAAVQRIDVDAREVVTAEGEHVAFERLLIATGSEPVRLKTPGFEQPNVYTLRSHSDARAIIAAAEGGKTVAVVGASFIGLEVAASLRMRGLEVHVVAPDAVPMERVLGRQLGEVIRDLHEKNGVVFHLGRTPDRLDGRTLRLDNGGEVSADLVVLGVGVRPRIELAAVAGIETENGLVVDQYLETSRPGIFAAGDVARYPDDRSGERIRVEHWVAAQRQGQTAAANMLGERQAFTAVPFFWSNHYDLAIRYVGHGSSFDNVEIDGSIAAGDATVRYVRGGVVLAAASIGRDRESLAIEAEMAAVSAASRQPLPA